MPPRLKIDMSAANSAPSMPGGQIFAASTRSGRKPTSPRADWTTSSPSEKRRSSRPQARFACETSASGASPMIADATDDQRMTLLSRASLKRPLYAATPTSPATDPAALARPRKSGSKPSSPRRRSPSSRRTRPAVGRRLPQEQKRRRPRDLRRQQRVLEPAEDRAGLAPGRAVRPLLRRRLADRQRDGRQQQRQRRRRAEAAARAQDPDRLARQERRADRADVARAPGHRLERRRLGLVARLLDDERVDDDVRERERRPTRPGSRTAAPPSCPTRRSPWRRRTGRPARR